MIIKVLGVSKEISSRDGSWHGRFVHYCRKPFDFESGHDGMVVDTFSIGSSNYNLIPDGSLVIGSQYEVIRERVGNRDVLQSIKKI